MTIMLIPVMEFFNDDLTEKLHSCFSLLSKNTNKMKVAEKTREINFIWNNLRLKHQFGHQLWSVSEHY